MFGVRIRKPQAAVEVGLVPLGLCCSAQQLLLFTICQNGGVTGFGRFLVERITVGSALVLGHCCRIFFAFEQDLGQQEVRVSGIDFSWEIVEVLTVPVSCLPVVALFAVSLRFGMVVLRKVCKVALQMLGNRLIFFALVANPEGPVHAITFSKSFLALKYQARETALLVGLDDAYLENRRLRVVGVPVNKCFVCFSRILVALLLEVKVTKIAINDVRVLR